MKKKVEKKDIHENILFKKIFEFKKKNTQKQSFSTIEVIILIVIACLVCGSATTLLTYQLTKNNSSTIYKNVTPSVKSIVDTYDYILENYYGELDEKKLVSGAVKGMLESVGDPNTSFIDESSSNTFNVLLEGTFKGLGVEIYNSGKDIVILKVMESSPAQTAGLKVADIIKKIDGKDMTGVTTAEFVKYVSEKKENSFNITILRGTEELKFTIKKDNVILTSVTSDILKKGEKNIGYINVSIFANNTYGQFKNTLDNLEAKKIDSLIIDLRGNSGGHLTAVTKMLSLFLDSKNVIYQLETKSGKTKVYASGNKNKEYKIVLLVNGGSASASEIMTASLKENLNAYVIGDKTYGKGTVQELQTLDNGIQYKFTTKKWLTPTGNWINGSGIEPDLKVSLDSTYLENPSNETDNQLQQALLYLQ